MDLKYSYYLLKTLNLEQLGQGIKPGLNRKQAYFLDVSYPSLEEQKRIVAKVDELMALCDTLEAQQQQQAQTVLRANTAAINTLLNPAPQSEQNSPKTTGKETNTTPENSFEQNWQRIAQHFNTLYGCTLPMPKGLGRKKKYLVGLENVKALRQVVLQLAMTGNLTKSSGTFVNSRTDDKFFSHNIPSHWNSMKLNEITTSTQGVQIPKSKQISEKLKGFNRYLYISDFNHDNNLKYVEDIFPHKIVTVDDLIMANTGATCGRVYMGKVGILSNNLFKISFDKDIINRDFLFKYLGSPLFLGGISRLIKGGANPHMGHKSYGLQYIYTPPLKEQKRIVAKVDQIMTLCDQLEQQLTQSYSDSEKLMQATVKALVA